MLFVTTKIEDDKNQIFLEALLNEGKYQSPMLRLKSNGGKYCTDINNPDYIMGLFYIFKDGKGGRENIYNSYVEHLRRIDYDVVEGLQKTKEILIKAFDLGMLYIGIEA